MDEKMTEKALKEIMQLRKMDADDANEVIKGYHKTLVKIISENLEKVQNICELSPSTVALTDTAIIIAERDCFDDEKGNEVGCLAVVGNTDNTAKLINAIFDRCPNVYEKVMKLRGGEKVEEEKSA